MLYQSTFSIMSSYENFEAMERGDWGKVKEITASVTWTPAKLEKKHRVQSFN